MSRSHAAHVPRSPADPGSCSDPARREGPGSMLPGVRLERILERQAGVITLAQATGCGMSADVVQRRAASGSWTRLHPAVYLVGGHRLTDAARVWAAWLSAGEGAAVSGRSAAFAHGMLLR